MLHFRGGFAWFMTTVLLLVYLIAGLYPFAWVAPTYTVNNSASRAPDGVLRFAAPGIALGALSPVWLENAITKKSLALQLEVQIRTTPPLRTTRIFALSGEGSGRNFVVDQQGGDLVVRVRKAPRAANQSLAHRVHGVFAAPGAKRIVIHFTASRLTVSVNDSEVYSVALENDPFMQWSTDCRVALGNSLRFNRPWLGEIQKAEVHVPDEKVDYVAAGMVQMPASLTLQRPGSRMRLAPFARKDLNRDDAIDWAINLAGFMPLGFWIVYLRRPRRSLLVATLACAALSLGIENLQCYLAGRSSSIDDLLLNTLGGALGAWLGQRVLLRKAMPAGAVKS